MKIQLLLTGNEIMSGDIVDSNSSMIAKRLSLSGIDIYRKVVVGDDMELLISELQTMSADADVLIVNGGLGPTIDDLTAEALAKACGVNIKENGIALKHLEDWCHSRGMTVNSANRKQAMLPSNVDIIANPVGTAVGFSCQYNNCLIMCTPGVPSELRAMLDEMEPLIVALSPATQMVKTSRIRLFGIGESTMQQDLDETFPDWPANVELGFRANMPILEVKLTTRTQQDEADRELWQQKLVSHLSDYLVGFDDMSLPQRVLELLAEQNKQITVAESCTGGMIASQLTSIAGASKGFEAGFVTYSNEMKTKMIGVPTDMLAEHGAVSEPVVLAMAEGALQVSGADIAVAVSGVAGPDGGTDDKPVGTVWIAWGSTGNIRAIRLNLGNNRQFFQTLVTAIGFDLVRRDLLGITAEPRYFRDRKPK
jgi:nicotinamide-nucleotide amidase